MVLACRESNLKLPSVTNVSSSSITGDVITFSGTTTVQLGSTVPPSADYFSGISGTFAGVLDITLQNGFAPTVGEQFKIFGFGSTSTGSFSAVNLPALPISEAWDTSQLFTTGVISVVPEPTGAGMLAWVVWEFSNGVEERELVSNLSGYRVVILDQLTSLGRHEDAFSKS